MTRKGSLMCTASCILPLVPVRGVYVAKVVKHLGVYTDQVYSMLALCDVRGLLTSINSGVDVNATVLEQAIVDHLEKHPAAYGDLAWT